ncbi:MAG: 4a-hydroxytetrahydrobiopterin dehydratase [Candidatus Nanohaloarchaea archaeon]|nr:4a-hydroxytetrahydrobiopterin dehydratase [Candidatus Nanohaloarchaea archaeon]
MTQEQLSDDDIDKALDELEIWGFRFGKLATRVEFDSYQDSVSFANQVFSLAREEESKPEVKVTGEAVEIDVWTPDIGVTRGDLELAEDIEEKLRSTDLA